MIRILWEYFFSWIVYLLGVLSNCFPRAVLHYILQLFPYLILGSICYGLDVIFLSVQGGHLRAVVDNAAHGIIAFISWCIVSEIQTRKNLIDGIMCGFIACAIDVDHFIAAKSFNLQDALHLNKRPFLHATTIVIIVVPILQVWIAQNIYFLRSLPYLFAVAVISHHLRDGNRRGLWFWPLGSTPPLPYWMYITCTVALPVIIKDMKSSIDKFAVIPISRQNSVLMDV
ncbi:hypothetical protein OS493_003435 [Desmophyllum pertusum]|uniref:Transmembrane protein 267 n=1 Tax=Desmophyllum pertusum TaxID=174260 RepID=A0A9X0DBP7_9CNID|nr:hypothetical protein OS493_003435 [Desmophyllum pertusum]